MLQYITDDCSQLSIVDQARLVIEGGCRWIQLAVRGTKVSVENEPDGTEVIDITPTSHPTDSQLRPYVDELTPLCKETESFLIIEDDIDLVDEIRVHGVFLSNPDRNHVAETRERLGAHAIIGVAVDTAVRVVSLKGLDIDYVTFRIPVGDDTVATYRSVVKAIRDAGIDFHIVAEGEFPIGMLPELRATGVAGVAMSSAIASAEDPASMTTMVLEALTK